MNFFEDETYENITYYQEQNYIRSLQQPEPAEPQPSFQTKTPLSYQISQILDLDSDISEESDLCFEILSANELLKIVNANLNIQNIDTEKDFVDINNLKQSKKTTKHWAKINNTIEYVIKHTLRMFFDPQHKEEIEERCKCNRISSIQLFSFWLQKIETLKKYIGINKFLKLMSTKSVYVTLYRQFVIDYLRLDYPAFVIRSNYNNKTYYLSCATKLMYILKSSERRQPYINAPIEQEQ